MKRVRAVYDYLGGFGIVMLLVISPLIVLLGLRELSERRWGDAVFLMVLGFGYMWLTIREHRQKDLREKARKKALGIVNELEAAGKELRDASLEQLKTIKKGLDT